MDPNQMRIQGKAMSDLIADYWESLPQRLPMPDVKPGFLRQLMPAEAPENPEDWKKIFADIEPLILNTVSFSVLRDFFITFFQFLEHSLASSSIFWLLSNWCRLSIDFGRYAMRWDWMHRFYMGM